MPLLLLLVLLSPARLFAHIARATTASASASAATCRAIVTYIPTRNSVARLPPAASSASSSNLAKVNVSDYF